jgi:predicted TIM-barrel fold metal-dependent hydrolase
MDTNEWIDFRIRPAAPRSSGGGHTELPEESAPYRRVYGDGFTEGVALEDLVAEMEASDVRGVVQAEYEDDDPQAVNERVAAMLAAAPERLLAGIATTDPRNPDALAVLRRAHEELGLRGWIFQPGFLQVHPTDPRCAPILAYCEAEGHPVTIHTGVNFSRRGSIEYGRPIHVEQVACQFPDLTLVCNHGGWPWVTEMLAAMWKHDNVYAEFGGVAPKYMVGAEGGWQPIVHWMNKMVTDQVLLASDWPMLRYRRLREELGLLGLRPESLEAYCGGNARRLLEKHWPDLASPAGAAAAGSGS